MLNKLKEMLKIVDDKLNENETQEYNLSVAYLQGRKHSISEMILFLKESYKNGR